MSRSVEFIPAEISQAPLYPCAASPVNLQLRQMQVAQNYTFDVWSPQLNTILSVAEAKFLQGDRQRVATICSRLVWLMGAVYSDAAYENHWYGLQTQDWETVLHYAQNNGFKADTGVIDIVYSPQTIFPVIEDQQLTGWMFVPAIWEARFLNTQPCHSGVHLQRLPLNVLISSGRPLMQPVLDSSQSLPLLQQYPSAHSSAERRSPYFPSTLHLSRSSVSSIG